MRKNLSKNINESKESVANGLTASLDWIAFTIQENKKTTFSTIAESLGFQTDDFIKAKTGRYGYNSRYVLNTGGHMEI